MLEYNYNLHMPLLLKHRNDRNALITKTILLQKELFILRLTNEKQKKDFLIVNNELANSLQLEKDHVCDLKNMLQIISHKVRQPIAHMLGISSLLESLKFSVEIKTMLDYLKQSASALDVYTRELTTYVWRLVKKSKVK